jgi:CheY-like chemotaxis protein
MAPLFWRNRISGNTPPDRRMTKWHTDATVICQANTGKDDTRMEYMTLSEVRANADEIRASFEAMLNKPSLAHKKHAAQWRFLHFCVEQTLGRPAKPHNLKPQQLVHYKFQVEDKLRRLYLGGGAPLAFVFRMFSRRDAQRFALIDDEKYPEIDGYYLLVRDLRQSETLGPIAVASLRDLLEKVVTACIDAEFDAYLALPVIDEAKLLRWFDKDGPAFRHLMHTLKALAAKQWSITNAGNPSTKRVIQVVVKDITAGKAVVKTTEYQHLRWWSNIDKRYTYPYRETSINTYFLKQVVDNWLVDEHIFPQPYSSTPHRHKYRKN